METHHLVHIRSFSIFSPSTTISLISLVWNSHCVLSSGARCSPQNHRKPTVPTLFLSTATDMCCRDRQQVLFQVLLRTGDGRVRKKVLQRQTLCRPHISFALVDHQVILLIPGLQSLILPLKL